MNEAALRLRGVDALYGDSHVLHDVALTVPAGGLLALLGRNGAGKSTCMATITGWLRPRRGSIALFGTEIAGFAPEAIVGRGVALVPQGRRVFPSLSVRENLAVAARRGAWTAERVFGIFPRLAERQRQGAGALSGGEQQMLAIGRALMANPRVLLMDEPSEGLAPQLVAEVGRVIGRLRDEGLSILLVEQNIRLALALADQVGIINTGRIVFTGSPAELACDEAAIDRHLGVF